MTFDAALTYLYTIAPPFHQVGATAYKPGLDTMRRMMRALDSKRAAADPCLSPFSIPVVHIAGTNGKGSTSHLIASALAAAGYKVGLYTSPHLVSFCERIRVIERQTYGSKISEVGFRLVPEAYVAQFVEDHQSLFAELQPSFFEITTAMAFCWLAEQKVDVAVVEVGLGGLLDATNIVTPVLSVITNIGMDHTDLLGHSLAEIATQKAGIIKPGVPCVIGETHPETTPVFLQRARECGILGDGLETTNCRLWFADQCEFMRRQRLKYASDCELSGDYQQKNLQTAYVALQLLRTCFQPSTLNSSLPFERGAGEVSLNIHAIADGFAHVVTYTGLRGRWETLCTNPHIICDTGHNSHGVASYVKQLEALCHQPSAVRNLRIVFGMVADKDIDQVMQLLPVGAVYYFTQPDNHRALAAEQLLGKWQTLHPNAQAMAFDTIAAALHQAQAEAQADDLIFIGGSNYVVGEAIRIMNR